MKQKVTYVAPDLEISAFDVANRLCAESEVVQPGINDILLISTQKVTEIDWNAKTEDGHDVYNQVWE